MRRLSIFNARAKSDCHCVPYNTCPIAVNVSLFIVYPKKPNRDWLGFVCYLKMIAKIAMIYFMLPV